jgi:PAS domain S-box-containing protein
MKKVFSWLWDKYERETELWLHRHGHWFGALSFVFSLLFASLWFMQARDINETTTTMISHPREPVPGNFPSLDSLILSKVDSDSSAENLQPSREVTLLAKCLFETLGGEVCPQSGTLSKLPNPGNLGKARNKTVEPSQILHVQPAPNLPVTKQSLSDESDNAALFIPAFTLPLNQKERNGLVDADLETVLKRDPQLISDLQASSLVANHLSEFGSKHIFSNRPDVVTQAYFISASGVTRMWQRNATAKATRSNFNPHRVFQDRPYFWPALENPTADFMKFSYVSGPYFDVAGNGIVRTACWGVSRQTQLSDSVLCLDSEKGADPKQLLGEYIRDEPAQFQCENDLKSGRHRCQVALKGTYAEVQDTLFNKLNDLDDHGRFDDIQGGIYVIAQTHSRLEQWVGKRNFTGAGLLRSLFSLGSNSTVYFTVPVPRSSERDTSVTEFNLYKIDLARPHQIMFLYAILTAFFGFTAAVCFYVLHRARLFAVQFIREVEAVMAISPVPFCHLDERDCISSHNDAFRELLGYTDQELRMRSMRSLLNLGDSQAHYDIISKFRKQMLVTPAYEVEMEKKDGAMINVVISGSPLYMFPRSRHGKTLDQRPHTFGILLRPTEAKKVGYVPLRITNFEKAIQIWKPNTVA